MELLAPAGDFNKLKAVLAYGADAVYAGVPMFSLRSKENKFDLEKIKKAIEYTHNQGKLIFLTTNIYPRNFQIEPFLEAFGKMVDLKPDAFILSDIGLINLVRKKFPQAVLHLSVQANSLNRADALFRKDLGISRIILPRELTLKEIKEIHHKVPDIELEYFVHGAICMSYSGRCLLSNRLTGRDSNQGLCAQSCRWEYKIHKDKDSLSEQTNIKRPDYQPLEGNYQLEEKERPGQLMPIEEDQFGTYIMNSRDICLIDYLEELKEAGICSLKIEGRNKTIYYASIVTQTYRKKIDLLLSGKTETPTEYFEELATTSNRGFTPGFLTGDLKENSVYYQKNLPYQTAQFIGLVLAKKDKLIEVQVKNRFELTDKLELIVPGQTTPLTIKQIYKINNPIYNDGQWEDLDLDNHENIEKVEVVHGGDKNVVIAVQENVESVEFGLLRKKL